MNDPIHDQIDTAVANLLTDGRVELMEAERRTLQLNTVPPGLQEAVDGMRGHMPEEMSSQMSDIELAEMLTVVLNQGVLEEVFSQLS